jgi:predicted component of type VI protein secretion system
MECSACRNPNDPGRRFCRRCGAALGAFCGRCGFFNAADDDFCGGCGGGFSALPGLPGDAEAAAPGVAPAAPGSSGQESVDSDLEKLFDQPPPPPQAAPETPAATSQTEIDAFFRGLGGKCDEESRRPAPGKDPADSDGG